MVINLMYYILIYNNYIIVIYKYILYYLIIEWINLE